MIFLLFCVLSMFLIGAADEKVCDIDACQMADVLEQRVIVAKQLLEEKLTKQFQSRQLELDMELRNTKRRIKALECHKHLSSPHLVLPSNCLDLLPYCDSGVYYLYLDSIITEAYCDMETDGGGWTVFLSRQQQENQENFNRTWREYANGFGNRDGEYWLGLDGLHQMTKAKDYTFRAEAKTQAEGQYGPGDPPSTWGQWSTFAVDSEDNKFRLTLSGYDNSSSMGDLRFFGHINGLNFSTPDMDNGIYDKSCQSYSAIGDGTGFWYNYCSWIYPTKAYNEIIFYDWSATDYEASYASEVTLKIRPVLH